MLQCIQMNDVHTVRRPIAMFDYDVEGKTAEKLLQGLLYLVCISPLLPPSMTVAGVPNNA